MTYAFYIGSFFAALILSAGLTWETRNVAMGHGWVSLPRSARHLHKTGIPRLGGIPVLTTFFLVSAFAILLAHKVNPELRFSGHVLLFALLAAAPSFAVGIYDDIFDTHPWTKIAAQLLGGAVLYNGGIRVVSVSVLFGSRDLGSFSSLLLTMLWTVLIGNAFNLIDGLDGLAAGSALFSTFTMFVVALANDNTVVALLTVVLAGAILGFLRYNFNPASIFLGDCGSLPIGILLSALALAGVRQQKSSTLVAVAIPVVAFGFPIVEAAVSVARRFLGGRRLFDADREHIHHKLLDRGFSQRSAVVLLYGVSAVFGVMSLLLLSPVTAPVGIVLVIVGGGIAFGVQRLGYHEFIELGRIARRTLEQRQIIINNLAVRRGAENLARCRTFEEICREVENTFRNNDFDGFALDIRLASGSAIPANSVTFRYRWRREPSESPEVQPAGPAWDMSLQLSSGNGAPDYGRLVLSRCRRGALLVDINLLFSEYQPALARVCQRMATPAPVPARQLHRAAAMAAASCD
ncbi:MAG: glycosyltransferase family 4 protein [Terriglobales bacterium]